MPRFIAIDQHGSAVRFTADRPRAGLLAALGAKSAAKCYRDDPITRESRHVGYVIHGRWFAIARFIEGDELTTTRSKA